MVTKMNRVTQVSLGVLLAACTGTALAQQRPGYERSREETRSEVRGARAVERGESRVRGDDGQYDRSGRGQGARIQGTPSQAARQESYGGRSQNPSYAGSERGRADQRSGQGGRMNAPVARADQRQAYNYNARREGLPSSYGGQSSPSQGYARADYDRDRSQRGRDRDDRWDRSRDDRRDHDRRDRDRHRDDRWARNGDDRWGRHDRGWDRSYSDRRDHRSWRDHSWRLSWSHGWSGHRYRAPSRYYHPRGYSSRSWRVGWSVPLVYLAASYFVDYRPYGLAAPPYGCSWIRIDGDVLLVDNLTGEIVDILYGFYY